MDEWAVWLKEAGYPFDFLTETPPPHAVIVNLARLWYIEEEAAHPDTEWREYVAFIYYEIYGCATCSKEELSNHER